MNRLVCVLLVFVFSISIIVFPVTAEENIKVVLNGTELSFDVPPQIINSRTMVPMRAIFEALGADVYWIDSPYAEQIILAVKNEIKILMAIGQEDFIKFIGDDIDKFIDYLDNGQPISLDVPAQLVDGRTLVPIRAISDALGVEVNWEEATQTVVLACNEELIKDVNTDKSFYNDFIKFIEDDMSIEDEHIAETEGIRVYEVDYTKEYEDTLNAMFDNTWTLKSAEEKYEEHDPVCIHVDTRPQQFTEWTIEYHDGNGELKTFVFDNRSTLSAQIEEYVIEYIAKYYKENFYDIYLKDVPLAPSSYVFCFFTKMSVNRHDEDNQERVKKSDEYLEKLDTPEGTICLSKLTPANVFEKCPIYLSISVSFSGCSGDKKSFEDAVKKKIDDMAEEMNKFSNNHLTASISMGYHEIINLHDEKRGWFWTFIQGEQVYNKYGLYFERYVFDGYKGMFW